ncbi:beta-lactamase family protein [Flavihumibacter sediminis]|nr:beta-lactamase family protein [Flavihumibacter sediminis]
MVNRILTCFFIIIVITGTSGPLNAQALYFPDTNWQSRPPSQLKINKELLDSAVSFAINNETKQEKDLRVAILKSYQREPGYAILGPTKPRGGPAGIVIKNGYIVASWGDIDRVDMTFSVTKSYLSTIAGLALEKGLIRSIKDRVSDYVWDGSFDGPHNSKITWEHLLNQSSDWSGELFNQYDWADRPPREGTIDEWKNRKLIEPGTVFEYNDVRVNLLAFALLQVWRKPLPVVLKEYIQDPIGASTTWRWYGYDNSFVNIDGIMVQSVSGGGHFGGGLFISAADQARFGLLFLREGKWKDKKLLSDNWIKAVQQSSPASQTYGYLWWNNKDKGLQGLPPDIYYAAGYGGNYIIIDKANDLVVVTRWLDDSKLAAFMNMVIKSVQGK